MKRSVILLCLSVLLSSAAAAAAPQPARLAFEVNAVVGSAFAPGRQIVLYGCANPLQPYYRRLLSFLNVVTADTSSNFRWEAPEPNSVWFAIGSIPADDVVTTPGSGT